MYPMKSIKILIYFLFLSLFLVPQLASARGPVEDPVTLPKPEKPTGGGGNGGANSRDTQSISLTMSPSTIEAGETATLSASGYSGSGGLSYKSGTPETCSVTGNKVTGISSGQCQIKATIRADSDFKKASAKLVTTIEAATIALSQSIAANLGSMTVSDTKTISTSEYSGSGTISFSSDTTNVCTVDAGGNVTAVSSGTCSVTVTIAADDNYESASTIALATVSAQAQSLTVSIPNIQVGATTTIVASGYEGSGTLSYESTTPSVCTVSGSTVTAVNSGTCGVTAVIAADDGYDSATASGSMTVSSAVLQNQTVSFSLAGMEVGETQTLSASANGSGAITYTSTTTSVCTVSGTTLTAGRTGTCSVTATVASGSTYNTATATASATVSTTALSDGTTCKNTCTGSGMKTVSGQYGYCHNSCLYTACGKTGYNKCSNMYVAPEALIAAKCNDTAWVGISGDIWLMMMDGKYQSIKDWENRKTIANHWRTSGNSKKSYSFTGKNWSPSDNTRAACMWQ